MKLSEKYNLKIGDTIRTNASMGSTSTEGFTCVIEKMERSSFYVRREHYTWLWKIDEDNEKAFIEKKDVTLKELNKMSLKKIYG